MNASKQHSALMGITDAAKLTGRNASTITRAANQGRLSFHKDSAGRRVFDVAELERVFGKLRNPEEGTHSAEAVQNTNAHSAEFRMHERMHGAEKTALEREIELLRERMQEMKDQLDDMRDDRDHWRQQAETHIRLLTDQRAEQVKREEQLQREAEERACAAQEQTRQEAARRAEQRQRETEARERAAQAARPVEAKEPPLRRGFWSRLWGKP